MAGISHRGATEGTRQSAGVIVHKNWQEKFLSDIKSYTGLLNFQKLTTGALLVASLFPIINVATTAITMIFYRKKGHPKFSLYNAPVRVPLDMTTPDGSVNIAAHFSPYDANRYKGRGGYYMGVEKDLTENGTKSPTALHEVWLSANDFKTHTMVLGGTGSGKSELLYGLVANQLASNSGFILIDAKADVSLQARIYTMCRRFYRQEDLMTLTFADSDDSSATRPMNRRTNTMNLFASSSSTQITEMFTNMIQKGDSGGSDIWEGRCLAFVAAVTRPLVFMRDKELINLSPSTYTEYMELSQIEALIQKGKDNNDPAYRGLNLTTKALEIFLTTLPAYDPNAEQKNNTTLEQFGYITMQLTRVLADLAYNYGDIFNVSVGEIDISDVVLNRRCMTALLPSLGRSEATLNMLGRLLIGSIKQMMATSVGANIDGSRRLIVDARPTTAKNVFRIMLDECGYMMVKGISIIPAQARSLNIAMTFAAQSFTDIKKGDEKEAVAIWENTSVKFIGRFMGGKDTHSETWQRVEGFAGTETRLKQTGGTLDTNGFGSLIFGNKVHDKVEYNYVEDPVINLKYIQGQEDGDFILMTSRIFEGGTGRGGHVVPMKFFYTQNSHTPTSLRLNDLVPISNAGVKVDKTPYKEAVARMVKNGDTHKVYGRYFENIAPSDVKNHYSSLWAYLATSQASLKQDLIDSEYSVAKTALSSYFSTNILATIHNNAVLSKETAQNSQIISTIGTNMLPIEQQKANGAYVLDNRESLLKQVQSTSEYRHEDIGYGATGHDKDDRRVQLETEHYSESNIPFSEGTRANVEIHKIAHQEKATVAKADIKAAPLPSGLMFDMFNNPQKSMQTKPDDDGLDDDEQDYR